MEQIESLETDPHKSSQLIFDKGAKANSGTKVVFPSNGVGTTGQPHTEKQ